MSTAPIPPASVPPAARPLRRWAEGLLFVAAWIGIGLWLPSDANLYLLIGVPLTVLFQLGIRRAPLRALWVRDAPPFRLGRSGLAAAVALAILPACGCAVCVAQRDWVQGGWFLAAVAGAVAAGYALHHFRRATLRPFFLCLATAGTVGVAIFLLMTAAGAGHLRADPLVGLVWLLLYFPAVFVLEEVSFRGALDSHLYRPGERFGWLSAVAVSALWGLWHLPTLPPEQRGPAEVMSLVAVHCAVGVPLSVYWRQSGNLAVPAFTHALIDAVRNALQAAS